MKSTILMAMASLFTVAFAFGQEKTDSVKVYGNCGMCKSRIEKAAKVEGVQQASWDKQRKMLTVTYDSLKISLDQVQQKVAAAGHDTERYDAADKVYEKLPGCCHYERSKKTSAPQ